MKFKLKNRPWEIKQSNKKSKGNNDNTKDTDSYLNLAEEFKHEAEDPNYMKIDSNSHPKLFDNILNKGFSIFSDINFSHTCKTRI